MVDIEFTPRLVYLRLKEPATFPQVAQPGMYQETKIAATLNGNWQPLLDKLASASRELVTRQPGARATIKFWGDSIALIMQRGPTQGRAWITLDGRPAPNLPVDTNGNSYLEFAAPNDEWQVRVPIAEKLPRQQHTIELTVGQTGDVSFDGFIVSADSKPEFPWLLVIGSGATLVIASLLFLVTWWQARKAA